MKRVYEHRVADPMQAVRQAASMLGELHAEQLETYLSDVTSQPPPGQAEVYVQLSAQGGTSRCPVALHIVQTLALVPIAEMDAQMPEGGT
jgi:hypothetical protein